MKFSVAQLSLALVCTGIVGAASVPEERTRQHTLRRLMGRSDVSNDTATSRVLSKRSNAFSSGIKRGLSYNDATLTEDFTSAEVSWAYNWGSTVDGDLPDGIVYIPMLWGDTDTYTASWSTNAQTAIDDGATYLLGFNEPDDTSQSDISPEDAATAWLTYMEPFADQAYLVSPAVTNGAPPSMGTGWMDEFLDYCSSCTIDALAFHIYDSATNIAYYEEYISDLASTYDYPIWITEFGATGTDDEIDTFLGEMVTFLDDLDGLATYAWFMDEAGNLVNDDSSLTTLGEIYIGE